jgi:uncharacterized RDD family membrane protein YckC
MRFDRVRDRAPARRRSPSGEAKHLQDQPTAAGDQPVAQQPTEQQPVAPPPSTATTGKGPSGPRAGFWRRFAAAFVDGIVVGIIYFILFAILGSAGRALGIIISAAYFTYFEGSASGQTIGKRALGIRVIDFGGGGSIGHGRAFIRWIGRFVSEIVILLGYFWMLWDKEKQTWHDKFANAVVVPTDAYPVTNWPG